MSFTAPRQDGRLKPIAGYPSRTAAIRDMLSKGLGIDDIASRLGIDRSRAVSAVATIRDRDRLTRARADAALDARRERQERYEARGRSERDARERSEAERKALGWQPPEEFWRLRNKSGWSVTSLARRYRRPEAEIARILGVPWGGERVG